MTMASVPNRENKQLNEKKRARKKHPPKVLVPPMAGALFLV